MISYECKYCHKQKKIYFEDKNNLFCDDFCKYNYLKKNKKNTICKICKKEFLHNGEKIHAVEALLQLGDTVYVGVDGTVHAVHQ